MRETEEQRIDPILGFYSHYWNEFLDFVVELQSMSPSQKMKSSSPERAQELQDKSAETICEFKTEM